MWFYPLVFDWIEADLNANLRLTVRKGQSLNKLNSWRSLLISQEDTVMTFGLNITRS